MPVANPLAEFEEISRHTPNQCVVARQQAELEPEDREKLEAALDAPHISDSAIVKWFAARGVRIGTLSVKKHRNGECCCV